LTHINNLMTYFIEFIIFILNVPTPHQTYTLSLHDALPILHRRLPGGREGRESRREDAERLLAGLRRPGEVQRDRAQHDCAGLARSEEHTSELQSRGHLVCRLLLEKKKKKTK